MSSNVIDFDAFRAEQKNEPKTLRIGGVDYELPASLPAAIAIDAIRLKEQMGDDDAVPITELNSIGESVFGPETWRAVIVKHRLGVEEMGDLFKMVLERYTGNGDGPLEGTD